MTATDPVEHYVTTGDLIAEFASRAPRVGPNAGPWPGLTIYRFTAPAAPRREEVRGLSFGIVAQGRKAITDRGRRYVYGPFDYLVIGRQFHSEVLDASPTRPCLCLVLHIDTAVVRSISADMLDHPVVRRRAAPAAGHPDTCVVSVLDDEVLSAVLRFLRSLSTAADRRVLSPLYLRELVYRILERDHYSRILHFAAHQITAPPVAATLAYIHDHLAEPLLVNALAAQANLSPSAFSRAFRAVIGTSPYQYIKEVRFNRSRDLLSGGDISVADAASSVGYTSTSHFIKEFRTRFGVTPGEYGSARQ